MKEFCLFLHSLSNAIPVGLAGALAFVIAFGNGWIVFCLIAVQIATFLKQVLLFICCIGVGRNHAIVVFLTSGFTFGKLIGR